MHKMKHRKKETPGLDQVRSFPYYKIQIWRDDIGAWKDIQKKFKTKSELHSYAHKKLERILRTRIIIIEDYGCRRIERDTDAFGEPL